MKSNNHKDQRLKKKDAMGLKHGFKLCVLCAFFVNSVVKWIVLYISSN
jgi:hypothetical protein